MDWLGGCGFQPGHTQDYKNGTHFLASWHSAFRSGLGGLDLPSAVLLLTAHQDGSNLEDKFHIVWDVTISGTLTFGGRVVSTVTLQQV